MSSKHSAAMRRRWADPAYRRRQIAVLQQQAAMCRRKGHRMSKGRTPPPPAIDLAADLLERLARVAHDAGAGAPSDDWAALGEQGRAYWRNIAQAVKDALVKTTGDRGEISVSSIYGYDTQRPYVQIAIDISPTQVTPGKAREIGMWLLAAAEAAESDALIVQFGIEQIGLDIMTALMLLSQFRAQREQAERGEERT